MQRFILPVLLLLYGCRNDEKPDDTGIIDTGTPVVDDDGDGYPAEVDCDDGDSAVHPDAAETCNGIDDDCNGETDEGLLQRWWTDADGDGYGDPAAAGEGCEVPDGVASPEAGEDCDDGDAFSYPGAAERCDDADNDCDGEVDEELAVLWHADGDGDGYGDPDAVLESCDPDDGWVVDSSDCDDTDPDSYPGGTEVCDEADNNCDGSVDEGVTTTFYVDVDGDGFGDASATTEACATPVGYSRQPGDCQDADASISPVATEVCDGLDNDCDGSSDEDSAADASTWYTDSDGDGFGQADSVRVACTQPSGHVADGSDCDDTAAAVNPGVDEVCDSIDNDCDGHIDEDDAVDAATWAIDHDGDGFGATDYTVTACSQPSGYVPDTSDCDDTDSGVYPGAAEHCDGVDENCDGSVDEDAIDPGTWYADNDNDGFGSAESAVQACEAPSGYGSDASDCNDDDTLSYPGASEICDGQDNDCDGTVDENDANDAATWYLDLDGDGYGGGFIMTLACTQPAGFADNADDCDDGEADANPGASEVCDEIDNDCDGSVDEGLLTNWYLDADGDGYGLDASAVAACVAPTASYSAAGADCDDWDSAFNPGAAPGCDGEDYDCDGAVDNDGDGDGYADGACGGDDCDDSDASIYPEPDGGCALGANCAQLLALGYTSDGQYLIDPDGAGGGVEPYMVSCDMSTDGGGWTLVVDWDREYEGDDLADFESHFTQVANSMSSWIETAATYIEWADVDITSDVLAYERALLVPNGGEASFGLHYYGYSMDCSGTFFWVQGADGVDQNLLCKDDTTCSPSSGHGTDTFTAEELALQPSYVCSENADTSWTWQDTWDYDFGVELDTFSIAGFQWDAYGDYSRLYWVELWVR